MDTNTLGQVEYAALTKNGWRLVAAVLTNEGGNGYVPHGIVMIEREEAPTGREMRFATAGFYVQPDSGPGFESGSYDLTREEAYADLLDRVKEAAR